MVNETMLESVLQSFSAVAIVLSMVAIGWIFGKLGFIRRENKRLLVNLIICAGMPALVVNNMFGSLNLGALEKPLLLFLLPLVGMLFTLSVGMLLARCIPMSARRKGGFITMCAFSNSIFVGLPMNIGLFGDEAIPYVMCFYIVNTTLFWTIGNYLISRSGEHDEPKRGIKQTLLKLLSPPLIALMLSIPLLALGVKLPQPIIKLSGYMGGIVTPLALLYIGYALYEYGFKSLRLSKEMLAVIGVRCVLAPLSMLGICMVAGLTGMPSGVMTVEAAMPVMTQAVVVAAAHNSDESFVAAGMSITTIGCFVLVPLLMLLMRLLGFIQ